MTIKMTAKSVGILLVEDNEVDVRLIEEVFDETKIRSNLHIAKDGEDTMPFYMVKGSFQVPTPRYNSFGFEFTEKRWT